MLASQCGRKYLFTIITKKDIQSLVCLHILQQYIILHKPKWRKNWRKTRKSRKWTYFVITLCRNGIFWANQGDFSLSWKRSSGLFRICNPIISLRHFYSIFAWICIEICGLIIWLVVRKNTQYQALSAFYGEIRSYETGRFALYTKFHLIFLPFILAHKLTNILYYIFPDFSIPNLNPIAIKF